MLRPIPIRLTHVQRISVYLRWGYIPTCDFHLCNGPRIRTETFMYHSWNSRTNTFFYPIICTKIIFLWLVCVWAVLQRKTVSFHSCIDSYTSIFILASVRKRYTNTFHHLCIHATVKTYLLYLLIIYIYSHRLLRYRILLEQSFWVLRSSVYEIVINLILFL